ADPFFLRQYPAVPAGFADGRGKGTPVVGTLAENHFLTVSGVAQVQAIDATEVPRKKLRNIRATFHRMARVNDQVHQRRIGLAQKRFDLKSIVPKFGIVIVIAELHPAVVTIAADAIESFGFTR